MTLSKYEELRRKIQMEAEQKLAKLEEEERKEKERRIKPLVSKYVNLTEEVLDKILKDKVEELETVRFRKTDARKRLEEIFTSEIDRIIMESSENSMSGNGDDEDDSKPTEIEEVPSKESDQKTSVEEPVNTEDDPDEVAS